MAEDSNTAYNVNAKHSNYVVVGDNTTVNIYLQKDGEPQSTAVACSYPSECMVVQKEIDINAGEEENKVYDKGSPSGSETTIKPEADTTQESQMPRRLVKFLRRLRSKISPGSNHEVQSEVLSRTNQAYTGSLPALSGKSVPASDKMCHRCKMQDVAHLPQDRDKWPVGKIEKDRFQVICNLLDVHYLSKEQLLSALGFTQDEATSITQEFKATKGRGMANKALGIWGTSHRKNNVGALKKIVKCTMKRFDVFCVIENWERLSVCHGCGTNLQEL